VKQEVTAGGVEENEGETKYHSCSTSELLNIVLENREQLKALQKLSTKAKNGQKKGTATKLSDYPEDDRLKINLKMISYQRELTELALELKKRGMGRGRQPSSPAASAAAPAAATAAPAATTKKLVAEVPMKQEATAGGVEEKKGETKYHGCSREELLNRILENREQLKALQNVRTKGKNGQKKGTQVKLLKLPKDDRLKIKLKMISYQRELTELYRELRKRDMQFVTKGFGKNTIGVNLDSTRSIHACVADDGVGDDGSAAEQDVVFSSTDDELGGYEVISEGIVAPSSPPCHPWAHSSMCRFSSCCLPLTSSNSFPSRSRLPSTFGHSCLQRRSAAFKKAPDE
jgi:hypothetical protein